LRRCITVDIIWLTSILILSEKTTEKELSGTGCWQVSTTER
jgi:hypothetical protein